MSADGDFIPASAITGPIRRVIDAKFERYKSCATLEVYMLVSQDEQQVEVYRRENNWRRESFTAGQTIRLDQLDLEFSIDEIYEGIL